MLYDTRWDTPDLEYQGVSLRAFIAWLETMPAGRTYPYCRPDECATAQFLWDQGKRGFDIIVNFQDGLNGPIFPEAGWLHAIICPRPHTFGAALARAKQYRVR